MKKIILLLLITAVTGCTPKTFENVFENTLPNDVNPEYYKLNVPLGSLDLPGIFIGQQETPSGSCFSLLAGHDAKETDSYAAFVSKAKQEKSFEAGLKAELKKN